MREAASRSPRPVLRAGGVVAALVGAALGGLGCGDRHGGAAGAKDGAGRFQNVVVVCIDTWRADSLAAYGRTGPSRMPRLDAFAATATAFVDASAAAAWTAPSISTLLTGLEPSHHGVVGQAEMPLVAQVVTLAERLKRAGWSTAAITGGAWMSAEHGASRGFDGYRTEFDFFPPEELVAMWDRDRPKDKPYFLFLHTYAAHDPYGRKRPKAPVSAAAQQALADEAARLVAYADSHGGALPDDSVERLGTMYLTRASERDAFGRNLDPAHLASFWARFLDWIDGAYAKSANRAAVETTLRDAYRDGLALADDAVARALAALDALPSSKDTVVVVCGDHGEAFGEHEDLVHGRFLYDELVRVPLLIRAPGALPAGRLDGACGLVDVVPTVLDLLGVPPETPLDGRSLLAFAHRGVASAPVHAIVAEEQRPRRTGDPLDDLHLTSVRTERAKYVITRDGRGTTLREELYDLAADPREASSLPLDRLDSFGADFCATARAVRAAPRSGTRPGERADPSTCATPR